MTRIRRAFYAATLLLVCVAGGLAHAGEAAAVPGSVSARAAALGYHPSTVLVNFKPAATRREREAAHRSVGAHLANAFPELRIDVVSLPDGLDPRAAVARYEARPGVAGASLNTVIHALDERPNDALFGQQWGFHNTGQAVVGVDHAFDGLEGVSGFDIDAPEGWAVAFPDGFQQFSPLDDAPRGTRVAILDTGIDRSHVDLLGTVKACASSLTGLGIVVEGFCADDNLHGTHVAGTVAANTDNDVGVAGTAPSTELAIFKVLNAAGRGFVADSIAGIRWAHEKAGAKVISMSYGRGAEHLDELEALKTAYKEGVLLVAAAGNSGSEGSSYPAAYADVMSVASTNAYDDISYFSTCNGDVEIGAPGEDIWSTLPRNTYGVISGTSMATPHVAGAGALLMSRGLSAPQARKNLVDTATAVAGDNGRGACSGVEQLNLVEALKAPPDNDPPRVVSVSPGEDATAVAVGTNVSATFSEAMQRSSIDASSFTLTRQGSSSALAASISYDAATQTATLDPAGALEHSTTYVATVKGGAEGGVRDEAGNPLAADRRWSFTTAAAPAREQPRPGPVEGQQSLPSPPADTSGRAGAGAPSTRSYRSYCKRLGQRRIRGQRGTPASRCIEAMKKLATGKVSSPRAACRKLSAKRRRGQKRSDRKLCVQAGRKLLADRRKARS